MDNKRAYGFLTTKAIDAQKRIFSGVATTPATDRVNDTINPLGVSFKNPIVLLRMHDTEQPIGQATLSKPTAKGINFEAQIPIVEEPGRFRDRVDMAWSEISYGVVRAVSIGFKPIKYAFKEDGGIEYQEIEIYDLSPVSVPALPEAIISAVKSLDGALPSHELIRSIRNAEAGGAIKLIKCNTGSVRLKT